MPTQPMVDSVTATASRSQDTAESVAAAAEALGLDEVTLISPASCNAVVHCVVAILGGITIDQILMLSRFPPPRSGGEVGLHRIGSEPGGGDLRLDPSPPLPTLAGGGNDESSRACRLAALWYRRAIRRKLRRL